MIHLRLTDEKTSQLAARYVKQVLETRALHAEPFDGEALKSVAPHPQINKFLLFQVYQALQAQEARLRHPFFDFADPAVQETTAKLFSLLSRHIRISSADLKGLMEQAAFNHIRLALDPVSTLSTFFFGGESSLSAEKMERLSPFFEDFGFLVRSILAFTKKQPDQSISTDTFRQTAEKVLNLYAEKTGEPVSAYQEKILRQITGYTFSALENEVKAEEAEKARLEAARAEQEKAHAEAEARRRAEEAARQAEEAARAAEEAARLQALQEELASKAEKPVSFFETIQTETPHLEIEFDLDDQDVSAPSPAPEPVAAPEKEEEEVPAKKEVFTSFDIEIGAHKTPEVRSQEFVVTDSHGQEPAPFVEMGESRVIETTPPATPEVFSPHETAPETEGKKEVFTSFDIEIGAHRTPEVPSQEVVITDAHDEEMRAILEMADAANPETTDEDYPAPDEPRGDDGLPKTIWSQLQVERTKTILDQINQGPVTQEPVNPVPPATVANRFLKEETSEKEEVFVPKFPVKAPEPEQPVIPVSERIKLKEEETEPDKPFSLPGQENKDRPKTIAERLMEQAQQKQPAAPKSGPVGKPLRAEDIPIHKQYQFVQKVFEGNNVRFRVIFDKVNSAASRAEIKEIIDRYILPSEKLNPNDPVVQEFMSLLLNQFPE